MRYTLVAIVFWAIGGAMAQPNLEWQILRQQVVQYHPLARLAATQPAMAEAQLLKAKGGFDPKTYGDFESKNFAGSTYFRTVEGGIKWPTLLGLELKGAYTYADGKFLNPEHALPEAGQAVFGFNWTLAQGLLIDERRAGTRQARVGLQRANAERAVELNDLLLYAAKSYWEWVLADNQLRLYEDALDQAQIRFEGLKESFMLGYKPAIDTVEAYIQVQNRSLDVNFGRIELRNAVLELANYYWLDEQNRATEAQFGEPIELATLSYIGLSQEDIAARLSIAQREHPSLQAYRAKLQELNIERRLKQEKRKPVLDLNYNLLGNGWSFTDIPDSGTGRGVISNNIKWGLQFSYPILNRKARGDQQMTQIKLAQTDLQNAQKSQEIDIKIRQYANDLNNLNTQIRLYESIMNNRKSLLDAENERFKLGSSSVFLIVTREQSLLDTQIKYLKLLCEYRKAAAALEWAGGTL
jgi:outer membrane protein TolC